MNAKECSNYHTIALISHVSKIMLKILQAMLQQYVNRELQMCKSNLDKTEEPEQIQYLLDHRKSKGIKKIYTSTSLTMLKPLTVDHNKLWKIFKEMGIPKKPVCRTRSNN